jgi:hypothetical protein
VDYRKVGLDKFGKSTGFYNRQIQTWTTICASQEKVVDVETKEPVGKLPHFDESVLFFMNEKGQPKKEKRRDRAKKLMPKLTAAPMASKTTMMRR